jgi:hypothetical protein
VGQGSSGVGEGQKAAGKELKVLWHVPLWSHRGGWRKAKLWLTSSRGVVSIATPQPERTDSHIQTWSSLSFPPVHLPSDVPKDVQSKDETSKRKPGSGTQNQWGRGGLQQSRHQKDVRWRESTHAENSDFHSNKLTRAEWVRTGGPARKFREDHQHQGKNTWERHYSHASQVPQHSGHLLTHLVWQGRELHFPFLLWKFIT